MNNFPIFYKKFRHVFHQCTAKKVKKRKAEEEKVAELEELEEDFDTNLSDETKKLIEDSGKSPISLINEYCQRNQFAKAEIVDAVPPDNKTAVAGFWMKMKVGEMEFPSVFGRNKKIARTRAAAIALHQLVVSNSFSLAKEQVLPHRTLKLPEMPKGTIFKDIAQEVHRLFRVFCTDNPVCRESGKILAGIVMRDERKKEAYILSIATGNRCIKGDRISVKGDVLNDCHAEILARRGFVRFLYSQILEYMNKSHGSIFSDNRSTRNKLQIRERFTFHLYINTAPCGDGRVFTLWFTSLKQAPLTDTLDGERGHLYFYSEPDEVPGESPPSFCEHRPLLTDPKKHGVLRTKIEKGEGSIPVIDYSGVQTLDGISGGERLRTMSCSDKLLKWNVLGLQGALLNQGSPTNYGTSFSQVRQSVRGRRSRVRGWVNQT